MNELKKKNNQTQQFQKQYLDGPASEQRVTDCNMTFAPLCSIFYATNWPSLSPEVKVFFCSVLRIRSTVVVTCFDRLWHCRVNEDIKESYPFSFLKRWRTVVVGILKWLGAESGACNISALYLE